MWVLSYDISDNRRRRKVAKILSSYGDRVQESVFECHLSPMQRQKLFERLEAALKLDEDHFRAYHVCERCSASTWAVGKPLTEALDCFIF